MSFDNGWVLKRNEEENYNLGMIVGEIRHRPQEMGSCLEDFELSAYFKTIFFVTD